MGRGIEHHDQFGGGGCGAIIWRRHAGPDGRRAILILTDNLSTSYRLTDGQVIRELNKSRHGVERDRYRARDSAGRCRRAGKPANPDFTPANVYDLAEKTGGEWVKAGTRVTRSRP